MNGSRLSLAASLAIAAAMLTPLAVIAALALGADIGLGGRNLAVLANTIALTALTVLGAVAIGVPFALLTTYTDLPLRRFWAAILAAPLAIPSYLGAFAYFAAFGPGGELEALTGLPTPHVEGLAGAALVLALYTYPFVLLSTRAALQSLDGSVVDAARTLGLTPAAALRHVVLPRAANGIAAGALLVALYALSDFATPAILGVDTFTRMIYVEYNAFGLDRAAMMSLQLLALVVAVLWLESRVRVRRERSGRQVHLPLSRTLRNLALAAAALVLTATIVLPLGVFGHWLVREGAVGFEAGFAINSAYVAALAAAATLIAALPVAHAAAAGGAGRLCERIAYLGFGVPGIVMGTALVYVGLQLPWLYQSLTLLVLAYLLRFLPLAVGAVRTSSERVESSLVGAARSLGAGPAEAFRRVSLPLILPGVIAGTALVFLEVMRELPATLLLRPTGFETLATHLWRVYDAAHLGRAAVPALALVAVSAAALAIMLAGENRRRVASA